MKFAANRKIHFDAGPNLTPLVDVVMVLLIFLMIVGKFTGTELYLQSNLPVRQTGAGGATPPPGGFPQDEPIEVQVDSPLPDRFVARVGQYKAESGDDLRRALETMKRQLVDAGKNEQDLQLIISPGRTVKYKFLIDVYTAAQLAGFEKVGFTTSR
jgi:biopolymer transport protein ExbD